MPECVLSPFLTSQDRTGKPDGSISCLFTVSMKASVQRATVVHCRACQSTQLFVSHCRFNRGRSSTRSLASIFPSFPLSLKPFCICRRHRPRRRLRYRIAAAGPSPTHRPSPRPRGPACRFRPPMRLRLLTTRKRAARMERWCSGRRDGGRKQARQRDAKETRLEQGAGGRRRGMTQDPLTCPSVTHPPCPRHLPQRTPCYARTSPPAPSRGYRARPCWPGVTLRQRGMR
jgi:hypothetical protein